MNEDDVKNLSSSMAALTEQIKKNNAAILAGSNGLSDQEKRLSEIQESAENIKDTYEKQDGILKSIAGKLGGIFKSSVKLGGVLGSIGTGMFAANLVKDMVDLDNEMTALSVRMGKGKEGIKELKGSVHGLQKNLGTSYENAKLLVSELAKDKYAGNIYEAAAGIDLFSRASGVANTEVLELTDNLSKQAGMSTGSINAMYASMLKVQQSVGISDKGMNALVNTIQDMSSNMIAFGKTSSEIKKMATETTALVGAMEKVGISAQRSTQLVKDLTDPDRIEDNILLYSQLGISMEDAMNGDINIGALDGQFQEMADRIMQMGPIAGSQFAKSMGLSYKEVTKMANMEAGSADEIADKAMTAEEEALGVMKKLEASTEGIGTKIETSMNKLEGMIKSLPTGILVAVAILGPILYKKAKSLLHKIFHKDNIQASVETGVVGSFENSFAKVAGKLKGHMTKAKNIISGNIADAFNSTKMGAFFNGADKRIGLLVAKANKAKLGDRIFDAANKNYLDELEVKMQKVDAATEALGSQMQKVGVSMSSIVNASGDIDDVKFASALEGLDEKHRKAAEAIVIEYKKMHKEQGTLTGMKNKALGLEGETLKKYEKQEKIIKALNNSKAKAEEAENKVNSIFEKRLNLQEKINDLKEKASSMDKNSASYKEAKARIDSMADSINNLEKELTEAKSAAEVAQSTFGAARKMANDGVSTDSYSDALKTATDKKEKISNDAKSAVKPSSTPGKIFASAKMKVSGAFEKTTLGHNLAEAKVANGGSLSFKQGAGVVGKTAASAAGKAGKGALKGIAKGMGGILKKLGPMALIMSLIGKLMEKVQAPLEAMINKVVDKLSPVIEKLMPAIEALVNVVATKLLPPALQILSGIMKALHAILQPFIWLLKALEGVPLIGPALSGIGDVLDKATGPEVTSALDSAAKSLASGSDNMKKTQESVERTAEVEAQNEGDPLKISAEGGSFVASGTTAPTTTAANQNATSNTVSTQQVQSAEEALKDSQKEKNEKRNRENVANIAENTGILSSINDALNSILAAITKENFDIRGKDPDFVNFT